MNFISKIQEDALIIDQKEVALQTHHMRLRSPEIARRARAGQFVMLRIRDGFDPLLRRPFSFHRILPAEGTIEILYRVVGRGTWRLSQQSAGSQLNLIGPLGNGFLLPWEEKIRPAGVGTDSSDPEGERREAMGEGWNEEGIERNTGPVVLVAGGIGIAPLYELALQLAKHHTEREPGPIHLFYGARTAAEILPADFLNDTGDFVHHSTDDGSLGFHGNVGQLLRSFFEEEPLKPSRLYACGPLAMQYHVAKWALAENVPAQLSLEALMACGVGACLGCALPAKHPHDPLSDHYVHVCKDGPIFEAGSIEWPKIQPHSAPAPIFLYS